MVATKRTIPDLTVRYVNDETGETVNETNSISETGLQDSWEELTVAGQELAKATDRNRWAMGELAMRVTKSYGDDTLNKFAVAINVRGKTLYEYHRIYKFYGENSTRVENLSWSHHREAMRLKDLAKALWALDKASAKDWTVERMGMILSRYLNGRSQSPEKILDIVVPIERIAGTRVYFPQFKPEHILKLAARFDQGQSIRLVISDVKEATA
jgi:hypothetical protein